MPLEALYSAMDYLDARIPTIKGRPALRECLANLKSGVTVALVSLPLSISLALASNATPVQGVITAVWAGLVSALFGGSHYNIVGPTGALSGVLNYYSVKFGPAVLPLLAVAAGLLSLGVWAARLDRYLIFVPSAVMHGFTLGVAFIISANQLNFLLGLPKLKPHPEFMLNLYDNLANADKASGAAVLFFAVSFAALFTLSRRFGKVPWPIVLASVGIAFGLASDAAGATTIQTLRSRYPDLSIQLVQAMDLSAIPLGKVETVLILLRGACSIAVIAVLETLISARIADRMTKTLFGQSQEVLATGLANLASGFAGGIPSTAALARTALNVKSGATSRGSGIVSAVGIALLSSVLFSTFKYIPLPVIAAILVNTAYRMVEWHEIEILVATDRPMAIVMVVTAVICALEDPTMGIVYGTAFAMIRTLLAMMHGHAFLSVYAGTRRLFVEEFKLNDGGAALARLRARVAHEAGAGAEAARKRALAAAGAAIGSSASAIAATASVLRLAEADRAAAAAFAAEAAAEAARDDASYPGVAPAPEDARVPAVAVYELPGYCSYVAAKSHLDRLRALFVEPATSLPGVDVVAFSLRECKFVDPDAFEAVGDLVEVRRAGARREARGARPRARTLTAPPPPPQEMGRAKKVIFLLGVPLSLARVLCKLPWAAATVAFEDYGALLGHLRGAVALDAERLAAAEGGAAGAGADAPPPPSLAQWVASRVVDAPAPPAPAAGAAGALSQSDLGGAPAAAPGI